MQQIQHEVHIQQPRVQADGRVTGHSNRYGISPQFQQATRRLNQGVSTQAPLNWKPKNVGANHGGVISDIGNFLGDAAASVEHPIGQSIHNFLHPGHSAGNGLSGYGVGLVPGSGAALHAIEPVANYVGHHVLPEAGKLGGHFLKDLVLLPGATIQGVSTLGQAALSDYIHGRLHDLPHVLSKGFKGSVLGQLINHGPGAAWKTAEADPLYAGLEFTGYGGAIGRLAGAAGRTGALGTRVAEAAGTARPALHVLRDVHGNDLVEPLVRHYSPNILTKQLIQKPLDARNPDLTMSPLRAKHTMNLRVATGVSSASIKTAKEQHAILQAVKEHQPLREGAAPRHGVHPEANVVPDVVLGGVDATSRENFEASLHARLQHLQDIKPSDLTKSQARANLKNQEFIQHVLNDPHALNNWAEVHRSATDFAQSQAGRDLHISNLGLHTPDYLQRAALKIPMLQRATGAVFHEGGEFTPQHNDLIAANAEHRQAVTGLANARVGALKIAPDVRSAQAAVNAAKGVLATRTAQEHAWMGQLKGRYATTTNRRAAGLGATLKPNEAERLWRHQRATALAEDDLRAARQNLAEAQALSKESKAQLLGAAKDTRKDATSVRAEARAAVNPAPGVNLTRTQRGVRIEGPGHEPYTPSIAYQQRIMEEKGIPAAYVNTQAAPERGIYAFGKKAVSGLSRGSKSKVLSGEAYNKGAHLGGYETLARTGLHSYRIARHAEEVDGIVRQYAHEIPHDQAPPKYLEHLEETTGQKWVAINHNPEAANLQDEHLGTPSDSKPGTRTEDYSTRGGTAPQQDAIPEQVWKRLKNHESAVRPTDNPFGQAWQSGQRWFRNTVLPVSTKWVAGNGIEAGVRTLMDSGPLSIANHRLGAKVIDAMHTLVESAPDEATQRLYAEGAAHLEGATMGNRHLAMHEKLNAERPIVTTPEGRKAVLDLYSKGTGKVYAANRTMEQQFEKIALGSHARRQIIEMAGSWKAAQGSMDQYVQQLAKGYMNPALAEDAARHIDNVLGQYDKFAPATRIAIRNAMPFAPWYWNAAKFVYYTLPTSSPVLQNVALEVARASAQEWAADHNVPHGDLAGVSVGDLLASALVDKKNRGYLNIARYLPEGALTSGPVQYGEQQAFPNVQGAVRELFGQNPFGQDLKGPNGKVTDELGRLGLALNQIVESHTPLVSVGRRLMEGGATPYDTSTLLHPQTKPGTKHGSAIQRIFDILHPTYLGSGGSGGGAGYDPRSDNGGHSSKKVSAGDY